MKIVLVLLFLVGALMILFIGMTASIPVWFTDSLAILFLIFLVLGGGILLFLRKKSKFKNVKLIYVLIIALWIEFLLMAYFLEFLVTGSFR